MSTLHTLNTTAREHSDVFARLLRSSSPGDSVLLIENGVYNLRDANALQALQNNQLAIYSLQADMLARGLDPDNLVAVVDPVTVIDDSGFVELACQHRKVVSWFAA